MKNINPHATHPLQSSEWGKFREKTGVKVIRTDEFQFSIHKIPRTPFNIGYLPKGVMPSKKTIEELLKIGRDNNCVFIQLEPNVIMKQESGNRNQGKLIENFESIIHNSRFIIRPSAHPLFTKYNFILDITKSEDELLKNMHSKTRYNIRVAKKHEVEIVEDSSDKAFEEYLKLTHETTKRQKFFAHTEEYHRLMWETLRQAQGKPSQDRLTAHLFLAKYKKEVLVAWILFVFKDTLYYPYGASGSKFREVMASNLMMWEAIRFGKKLGLKKFDMWGALGPEPNEKDPWYGFHKFKQGYGAQHVEFVGSYDLVINQPIYRLYKIADKLRWTMLRLLK
ncbi:MAG: peptidoglycan bridge formation glycyltransferase FemA/FemB family protein [Candidatus Levyibacteriota bacterium]